MPGHSDAPEPLKTTTGRQATYTKVGMRRAQFHTGDGYRFTDRGPYPKK
jgi:hypothetical protein